MTRKRRTLPDTMYDFFVRDGRDGEEWGPFNSHADALWKRDRLRRTTVEPWNASVITTYWRLSEKKIGKVLRGK